MKTHTLRWNGHRTGKILTFTPAFEKLLVAAHPWASRFLVAALLKELRTTLDYDQEQRLNEVLAPEPEVKGATLAYSLRWLSNGHRMLDCPLERHLTILDSAARALFSLNEAPSV